MLGGKGNDVFVYYTAVVSVRGATNRNKIMSSDGASVFQGAGVAGGDRFDMALLDGNQLVGGRRSLNWGGSGGEADTLIG